MTNYKIGFDICEFIEELVTREEFGTISMSEKKWLDDMRLIVRQWSLSNAVPQLFYDMDRKLRPGEYPQPALEELLELAIIAERRQANESASDNF